MTEKTRAIVLRSIKFGESSLIVTCFTQCCGIKSYMLKGILKSRRSKVKSAHFQTLTMLELSAKHNDKGNLNSVIDTEIHHPFSDIHTTIKKQTIALFLGEVLFHAIKEEEPNIELYHYLETSLLWFDSHSSIANFHLLFLLRLTKYLGFFPQKINDEHTFFDLLEGKFSQDYSKFTISGTQLMHFKKLLGTDFDTIHEVEFSALDRQDLLGILIQYFELHLHGFKKPKSLDILKSVFSS
jgi:DNA repair protein RecO (recombination protein O)